MQPTIWNRLGIIPLAVSGVLGGIGSRPPLAKQFVFHHRTKYENLVCPLLCEHYRGRRKFVPFMKSITRHCSHSCTTNNLSNVFYELPDLSRRDVSEVQERPKQVVVSLLADLRRPSGDVLVERHLPVACVAFVDPGTQHGWKIVRIDALKTGNVTKWTTM